MKWNRKAYRRIGRNSSGVGQRSSDPACKNQDAQGDRRMTARQFKARTAIAAAALAVAAAVAPFAASTAEAGTLTMNIAFKGASQRAVWQSVIDDFKKAH